MSGIDPSKKPMQVHRQESKQTPKAGAETAKSSRSSMVAKTEAKGGVSNTKPTPLDVRAMRVAGNAILNALQARS